MQARDEAFVKTTTTASWPPAPEPSLTEADSAEERHATTAGPTEPPEVVSGSDDDVPVAAMLVVDALGVLVVVDDLGPPALHAEKSTIHARNPAARPIRRCMNRLCRSF